MLLTSCSSDSRTEELASLDAQIAELEAQVTELRDEVADHANGNRSESKPTGDVVISTTTLGESALPLLATCYNQYELAPPELRPTKIRLAALPACDYQYPAASFVEQIVWSEWGSEIARGEGQLVSNKCEPSCATGALEYESVTVILDRPVGGFFSRLVLVLGTYEDIRPRFDRNEDGEVTEDEVGYP